jgi:monofunctional biosynthetic peptidoglycan transglycosylase
MSTKILKIILGALLLLVLLLALTFFTAPDGSEFKTKNPSTTALIQRRTKEYRQAGKNIPIRWKWMPLKRISPYLIHATIIAEDSRFYEHAGVDPEALRFALKKNLVRKRYAIGGSTITQQLARNLYLTPRKSLVRKFKEIIIAYKMERKLSKRRILELYLNVIELGRGIYGVEAASRYYFGKAATGVF